MCNSGAMYGDCPKRIIQMHTFTHKRASDRMTCSVGRRSGIEIDRTS